MRKTAFLSLFLVSGVVAAQDVKILNLKSNDVIYLSTKEKLYVSTPEGGEHGNSLCVVNPNLGTIDTCYTIGGSPGVLAVSDDERYIYIGLATSPEIVRFDLVNQAISQRFPLGNAGLIYGPNYADDIAVMPGAPKVIAVSLMSQLVSPRHTGVAIFDDGVQRPAVTTGHTGSNSLAFDPNTGLLYGYNNESSEFGLRKMAVDAAGVSVLSITEGLFYKFADEIEYAEGRLYSRLGQVVDISGDTPTLAGQFDPDFNISSAGMEVAPDSNVVYFLNSSFFNALILQTYDKGSYNLIEERVFPNLGGYVPGLINWGGEGKLAFVTKDNIYNEHNHLVILRNCTSTITTPPLLEQGPGGCIGDTLVFQAAPNAAGPVFWANGQTGPTAVATTPGELWYQVADEQGCLSPPSNSVFAAFEYPPPQPYIEVTGSLALCQGGQIRLSTQLFPWYSGFLWNNGETSHVLEVDVPGAYSVQGFSPNGCPSEPSLPVTVYALDEPAPPQPAITVVGETAFCDNNPSLLQAPEGYLHYFWNNGDQSPSLVPYVSGEYSVQVMNEAGCLSPPSAPVSITVYPGPPAPDIFLSNDNFLYTSAPVITGLQWLLNGEPIPGATSQVLQVTETGFYRLQLTGEDCSSLSNEIYVLLTGIDEQEVTEKPTLFPNPSADVAYLRLASPLTQAGMIRIRSGEGKLLRSLMLSAGQEVQELSLSGLPAGLYVVEAFDGNGTPMGAARLVKR